MRNGRKLLAKPVQEQTYATTLKELDQTGKTVQFTGTISLISHTNSAQAAIKIVVTKLYYP